MADRIIWTVSRLEPLHGQTNSQNGIWGVSVSPTCTKAWIVVFISRSVVVKRDDIPTIRA